MQELEKRRIDEREVDLATKGERAGSLSMLALTRSDIISAYRVAEFVTLASCE